MKFRPEFSEYGVRKSVGYTGVSKAIEAEEIMEALVESCDSALTLKLNIGENIKGFITFDELEYRVDNSPVKDISAMSKVGKHVQFIPKSIRKTEDGNGYIVECSRKQAQEMCYKQYISQLEPGDIIDARIVSVEYFGVFCDIGCGVVALLPTNLISVTHIVDPKKLLKSNTKIKAIVKNVQADGKIQLSHRELLGTWEEESAKLTAGDIVCGTVLSVESYGVFIRLTQNLSGLAATTPSVEELNLKDGDVVSVRIKSIITDENRVKRVKLSILEKIEGATERYNISYYKTSGHIDNWVYTKSAKKCIETDFTTEVNALRDFFNEQ